VKRVLRKKLLWAMLLIAFAVSMMRTDIASAEPTKIYINPTPIPGPSPGRQFTIEIRVDYVRKLWAYQFELSFDPAVLQGVSVENGPFLGSAGGTVLVAPGPGFDNERGKLGLFGASLFPKARFPTGGGVLAYVTFEVAGSLSEPPGDTVIAFGANTGLLDRYGRFIIRWPDNVEDGYFTAWPATPDLWIRRKGAHGGGTWPEWHTGSIGQEQKLYSKIVNRGFASAWVKVKFEVVAMGYPTQTYWSNEVEIPAAGGTIENIEPTWVTVSTDWFIPPGPGKFYITAYLYFKWDGMTEYMHLYGVTRDIGEHFKVS
jgi:hypothetical protein